MDIKVEDLIVASDRRYNGSGKQLLPLATTDALLKVSSIYSTSCVSHTPAHSADASICGRIREASEARRCVLLHAAYLFRPALPRIP
jgi:hypothetical protein